MLPIASCWHHGIPWHAGRTASLPVHLMSTMLSIPLASFVFVFVFVFPLTFLLGPSSASARSLFLKLEAVKSGLGLAWCGQVRRLAFLSFPFVGWHYSAVQKVSACHSFLSKRSQVKLCSLEAKPSPYSPYGIASRPVQKVGLLVRICTHLYAAGRSWTHLFALVCSCTQYHAWPSRPSTL